MSNRPKLRMRCCLCTLALLAVFLQPIHAFDRALPGYEYKFPRDHFSHPNYQVEWWYYTGNVKTDEGRKFGFELTFFRLGVAGQGESKPQASAWNLDDIYLAHFTVSDIKEKQFHKTERLNRAGPGLAGADEQQARIWNGNWEVRWLEPLAPLGRQHLRAIAEDFSVELDLTPAKPAVVHGENGVSRKAEGEGRASHYISFTRLSASGKISLPGEQYDVSGSAWMDHEFSTESMGPDQAGWDWMSVQLDNGADLMLYRMRRKDGSADPFSSGTYVDAAGKSLHLAWKDIVMTPGAPWQSPVTGGRYPQRWKVAIPRLEIEIECVAEFPEQEVVSRRKLSPTYWEGAVSYRGHADGKPVTGVGYLEMTGYDKPIELGARESRQ